MAKGIGKQLKEKGLKQIGQAALFTKRVAKESWKKHSKERACSELEEEGFSTRLMYSLDDNGRPLVINQNSEIVFYCDNRKRILLSLLNEDESFCGEIQAPSRRVPKIGCYHARDYSIALFDGQYDKLVYTPIRQTEFILATKGGAETTKAVEKRDHSKGVFRCFRLEKKGWEAVCDLSQSGGHIDIYSQSGIIIAKSRERFMRAPSLDVVCQEDSGLCFLIFMALMHDRSIEYPLYMNARSSSSEGG